jgi:DNA polymerase-1
MIIIDTEIFLRSAAEAATVDVEWQPDDWTRLCRHGVARELFTEKVCSQIEAVKVHCQRVQCYGSHLPIESLSDVGLAFGSPTNFRRHAWPEYKANRRPSRKPAGWAALLDWVCDMANDQWNWLVLKHNGIEADDVMGIYSGPGRIIVSTDKDMLTVPGRHWRDGTMVYVSERGADLTFYSQVLTGDVTDGYPGCPGVGPVAARKLLADVSTPQEMWLKVLGAYEKAGKGVADAIAQARCARILRPGEYDLALERPILWTPPV